MPSFGDSLAAWFRGAPAPRTSAAEAQRQAEEWQAEMQSRQPAAFAPTPLAAAASGKAPWLATLSPAELALARGRGIRPLAMVSGACWYQFGQSWSRGQSAGWHQALARLKHEAVALGASAVVDVKLRRIEMAIPESTGFAVVGTAVRLDGLPAAEDPALATVSALEFLRLVEADIVPVGIAVGAHHAVLEGHRLTGFRVLGGRSGRSPVLSYPATRIDSFRASVRRQALKNLRDDALRQGNGVLAHTHLSRLECHKRDGEAPAGFLGCHIVIGTVVDTTRAAAVPHSIRTVVDMRDGMSPLLTATPSERNAYPIWEQEGAI